MGKKEMLWWGVIIALLGTGCGNGGANDGDGGDQDGGRETQSASSSELERDSVTDVNMSTESTGGKGTDSDTGGEVETETPGTGSGTATDSDEDTQTVSSSPSDTDDDTDTKEEDVCDQVVCNTPPANECASAQALTLYDGEGWCFNGACTYDAQTVTCEVGSCSDGICGESPCQGVRCETPPADACVDANTLQTFNPRGYCSSTDGTPECRYASRSIDCPAGCDNGRCLGEDPCARVVCDAPPARYCDQSGSLQVWDTVARCEDGDCLYGMQTIFCATGCEGGTCQGEEGCENVRCDDPPAAYCVTDSTLRTFDGKGVCDGGGCVYDALEIPCSAGCDAGRCQEDPCSGVTCDQGPSAYCKDENTLVTWDGTSGTCDQGVCAYERTEFMCALGCEAGQCIGEPCTGVSCESPPADYCADNTTAVVHASMGVCTSVGQCAYTTARQNCAGGCMLGACVVGGTATDTSEVIATDTRGATDTQSTGVLDAGETTTDSNLETDTRVPTDTSVATDTSTPTDTAVSTDTAVPESTDTGTPTDTAVSTDTAAPTDTATPTDTAAPTDTAVSTDTATPTDTAVADPCPGGCFIDGDCIDDNVTNSENVCEICIATSLSTGWSYNNDVSCSDGAFCTTNDYCSEGVCQPGPERDCEDDIDCNGEETCDEINDTCADGVSPCTYPEEVCDRVNDICIEAGDCPEGFTGDLCDQCVVYVNWEDGDDNDDGATWENAKATIQAGIETAFQAAPNKCHVWVADGTYVPTYKEDIFADDRTATVMLREGVAIYGGFSGGETAFELRNVEAYETIISGNRGEYDDDSDNLYNVIRGAANVVIDGFTIMEGYATGSGTGERYGGGLYVDSTMIDDADDVLRIENCIFRDNFSNFSGGAISTSVSFGTIEINRCVFQSNAANYYGGAIYFDIPLADNDFSLTIEDSRFELNSSKYHGGALYLDSREFDYAIINTDFVGNTATYSSYYGGAIYDASRGSAYIISCLFMHNESPRGGAIYSIATGLEILNSIFTENAASARGGALYVDAGALMVASSVFFNNVSVSEGGGIYNETTDVSVSNSIFWDNESESGSGHHLYNYADATMTVSHSNVQGTGFDGSAGVRYNIDAEPLFVSEGPVEYDLRLQDGSPCINSGDNALLPLDNADMDGDEITAEAIPYDKDGNARVQNGIVDMGAYESAF